MKRLAASLCLVCAVGVAIGCNGADEVTGLGSSGAQRAAAGAPTPTPAPPAPLRRAPPEGQRVGRGETRLVPPRATPIGIHPTYPPCINVTVAGEVARKNKPCSYD